MKLDGNFEENRTVFLFHEPPIGGYPLRQSFRYWRTLSKKYIRYKIGLVFKKLLQIQHKIGF